MKWLWLLVPLLLLFLYEAYLRNGRRIMPPKYVLNKGLMTDAEKSFFGVLSRAVDGRAIVFSKVRLADVLLPTKRLNKSSWQRDFNKISSKHFDYVLCCPETLSYMCAVELDDSTHSKKSRVERDRFLKEVCNSAGLALVRFDAKQGYNIKQVRTVVLKASEEARS